MVSHPVGVNVRFILIIGFKPPDEGIKGFGVVFRDIKLNAGGIERKHLCKGAVNRLADGLRKINHMLEHQFNIREEVLFKESEQGCVRHFGETAEPPQFPAEGKEEDGEGVGRDGKNLLEDKCREETGKWVEAFPSEGLVKSTVKIRGDKLRDIEMLPKELEERRGIIHEHIPAV